MSILSEALLLDLALSIYILLFSFVDTFIHSFVHSINQSINESMNQSINQSINRSINHSFIHLLCHSYLFLQQFKIKKHIQQREARSLQAHHLKILPLKGLRIFFAEKLFKFSEGSKEVKLVIYTFDRQAKIKCGGIHSISATA